MSAVVARQLRQFTVREYEQMIAAGVFVERGRVELLDGEIIEMAAMGIPHATCLNNLDYMLKRRATHPTPGDILLVVEVADRSLDYDRNRKFPRYAAAGIPEAWLFDVFAGVLERHTEPYEGRYRHLVTARRGEALASTTLPDLSLAVDAILAEDDE